MSKPARRCGTPLCVKRLISFFLVTLIVPLAGCSSAVSRFDYPVFGYTATDQSPTGAISPETPVYGRSGSSSYSQNGSGYQNSSGYQNNGYSGGQVPQTYRQGGSYNNNATYQNQSYSNNYGSNYKAPVASVKRYDAPSYSPPAPQPQPVQRTVAVDRPLYTPNYSRKAGPDGSLTVQTGDTLYSIARSNNVSVDDLKRSNNISGNAISVGQRLIMPGSSARPSVQPIQPSAKYGKTHTVRSGDTIYSIARTYGVRHDEIARVNNISNPNEIKLGQKLKLPHGAAQTAVLDPRSTKPVKRVTQRKVRTVPIKPVVAKPKVKKPAPKKLARLPNPAPRSQGRFRWPVRGRIIGKFGPKANGGHNDGINVAVPVGTSIKAVENGVVAYSGNELKGYGNLVLIRHSDNWVSAYAHNDQLLVKRGDKIKRGQVIAKAGRSGSVNQPQLHFELRKGSKPVDPMKYMAAL